MSEQESKQATLSSQSNPSKRKLSSSTEKQRDRPTSRPQLPSTNNQETWKTYWQAQGQLWRTELEIDERRQKELDKHRSIAPNIALGVYPFKGIHLSRADIEWLLATHENGRGPVNWNDEDQRQRAGLDLRGAYICDVNLRKLPLVAMYGGLNWEEWIYATAEQREAAAVYLVGTNLSFAHLEGANLRGAHFEGTDLYGIHLEGASLYQAHLEGTELKQAFFDSATQLGKVVLGNKKFGAAVLTDIHWNDVIITDIDWSTALILCDERKAYWRKWYDGTHKVNESQLDVHRRNVRTYRQIAAVVQGQGLNEEAAHFSYQAHRFQRKMLWLRGKRTFGQFLFSLFLDLIAGYGYKPVRSLFWYLFAIFGFTVAYYVFGHVLPLEALILSLTSFHGRGFFPGTNVSLNNPSVVLATFEAVVGLLIEISFIATFTQRFFGK